MRTLTNAQEKVLGLAERSTHVRVRIDRGSGDWVDLSDFEGYDWVHSVEYSVNADSPIQVANIKLFRQVYDLNLAPLVDGSKPNRNGVILTLGNPIVVDAAVLGQDVIPEASDWVEVHRGEIDDVSFAAPRISITSRDNGGTLVDTFMETANAYGSEAGASMESVIQAILDDHAPSTTYLYSVNGTDAALPGSAFNPADSPGFNILLYQQDQQNIMSAIRRIAQLIGSDVGYKWHNNTNAFQLLFQQPDRPVSAQGTLTFSGVPNDAETFVLNATTFTCKNTPAGSNHFQRVAGDTLSTVKNLARMFLTTGGERDNCSVYRNGLTVVFTWAPGLAGNSIVFTEALTTVTADGGGTLGGTRAGTDGATASSFTWGEDRYTKIPTLKNSRQGVRNVVEIVYEDAEKERNTVRASDAASIATYGRRYMKITEASTSQIDTGQEAADLAASALADLREPDIQQTITVPYFWPAEPGDVYTFEANKDHYDNDQTLTLMGVSHSLGRNSSKSTLTLVGKST